MFESPLLEMYLKEPRCHLMADVVLVNRYTTSWQQESARSKRTRHWTCTSWWPRRHIDKSFLQSYAFKWELVTISNHPCLRHPGGCQQYGRQQDITTFYIPTNSIWWPRHFRQQMPARPHSLALGSLPIMRWKTKDCFVVEDTPASEVPDYLVCTSKQSYLN